MKYFIIRLIITVNNILFFRKQNKDYIVKRATKESNWF